MSPRRVLQQLLFGAKALLSFIEILAGLTIIAAEPFARIAAPFAIKLARGELAEDPTDPIARWVAHTAPRMLGASWLIVGAVLAAYGVLKLVLIIGVMKGRRRLIMVAAPVFAVVAIVGVVLLLRHATTLRLIVAAFDVALAALVVAHARSTLRANAPARS